MLALSLVLVAGIAIGATGIGGILLVPALTSFDGREVGAVVAASSAAFFFTGLQAIWQQRRRASAQPGAHAHPGEAQPDGGHRSWLLYGTALIGSIIGALLTHSLAPQVLRIAIAALAIGSGAHALSVAARSRRNTRSTRSALPGAAAFAALGLIVGIGSSLSGTGGPVALLPLLMLMRAPLRESIALAQGTQLPIAVAATAVHASADRLDWSLALWLGALLLAGGWIGYRLAARVGTAHLRQAVAVALIAIGAWYGWRSL